MSPVPTPLGLPAVTRQRLALLLPGLAGDPSAPPALLVRLAAAGEARHALVRRRDLPPEAAVRRAAINPVLEPARLVELLASPAPAVAVAAASNRALPVSSMLHLLDQAGL